MAYKRSSEIRQRFVLGSSVSGRTVHNSFASIYLIPEMQFSVIALSLASVSAVLAADAISQIADGQIQATTSTATSSTPTTATTSTATSSTATSSVPTTSTTSTQEVPQTQTENGANQIVGGAAMAGLVAAGALLI